MKWKDIGALREESTMLKHIASGRLAIFVEHHDELTEAITVRFVDELEERRVSVKEFDLYSGPKGTVPREK